VVLLSFLPLGATAQGELWPPEQFAPITQAYYLVSEQFSFYGVRCPSFSGSYPLTCPAWVTLPVATLPPAGSQEQIAVLRQRNMQVYSSKKTENYSADVNTFLSSCTE
jgi:hypothetical protein